MTLHHWQLGFGPDLVLLHGWGMNAAVWGPLLPGLSERFRLTVIELPGHGDSAPASAADLSEWAELCLAVAPACAHWLGWSLGGQIALRAALNAPERVRGLSLVATTPRFVQAPGWPCAMPVETFEQFARALHGDPGATLGRFLALQVKGAEHARETLKLLRTELQQRPPASEDGLAQGLDLLLKNDLRTELKDLGCPSHWLFGSRDTLVPGALQERLPEYLPHADIEKIPGAGHAPFLSHPYASLDALIRTTGAI
ncbi:MAG: pimeloyl-ACP methyl ester esterase BioH [Sedimenticolaceae bacterium]|jgi:pimeloyl-[acyl-carrier protein] methyl ester esterase